MASLIVKSGSNEGNWYRLGTRTLTAGRDPANAVQIVDERVSRKHFQIRREGDLYLITDLKSHNGVYLNGHRIQEALLREGDVIQAGETVLVYTDREITDRTDALQYFKRASRRLRDDPTLTDRPAGGTPPG